MTFREFTGKNVEEAIRSAMKEFTADLGDLDIEILSQGSRGILGVGGDEVIHCILDIMYAKAPYTVIQRAVHIHPTVSELIPTMLGDLKPLPSA